MALRDALNEVLISYDYARRANNNADPQPMLDQAMQGVQNTILNDFPNMRVKCPHPVHGHRFPCQAWITVLHRDITDTPERGYYVAYLIVSYRPRNVILCFMSAVEEVRVQVGNDHNATIHELHQRSQRVWDNTESIIRSVGADEFLMIYNYVGRLQGETTDHCNTRALYYEKAIAFGKSYGKNLPENEVLADDLETIIQLYVRMVNLGIVT